MKHGFCQGQNFTAPIDGELLCKTENVTYAMDYIGPAEFDSGVGRGLFSDFKYL